jgi:DivIVA domain-containing protein
MRTGVAYQSAQGWEVRSGVMSSSALPVDQPFEDQPRGVTDITPPKFSTAWRGYDPTEVDAHLRALTEKVDQLQRSEARLRRRAEQAERQAELLQSPDEHRLIEVLGEETARVLDAARQAATDIRRKAEEAAARLISDANDQAQRRRAEGEAEALEQRKRLLAEAEELRQEAADELEQRRGEAAEMVAEMHREARVACDSLRQQGERDLENAVAEAEVLRSTAREDSHRLVAEAQTLRERTLRDLVRRRRSAREQLERLNAARERLLAAYEVVRRTVDEATTELRVALPEAKAAGDTAMRRAREEPEPTVEELEAQVTMAKMVGLLGNGEHSPPPAAHEEAVPPDPVAAGVDHDDHPSGTDSEPRDRAPVDPAGNGTELGYPKHAVEPVPAPSVDSPARDDHEPAEDGLADDQLADDQLADDQLDDDELAVLESDIAVEGAAEDMAHGPIDGDPADGEPVAEEDVAEVVAEEGIVEAVVSEEIVAEEGVHEEPVVDEPTDGEPEAQDAVFAGHGAVAPDAPVTAAEPQPDTNGDGARRASSPEDEVGDLFARLKAGRARSLDASATQAAEPTPQASTGEPDDDGAAVAVVVPAGADPDGSSEIDLPTGAAADAASDAETEDETPGRVAPGSEAATFAASPEDERLMRQRDETVESLERGLARRLKRVLADEQNEVLDLIRRRQSPTLAELLGEPDAHADRYADAAVDDLQAAALWGAAAVGGQPGESSDALADELGQAMIEPLRERVSRSLDETEGDLDELTERLRALYREWKGQRVTDTVGHYVAAAYARGIFDAVPDDALVRWVVDRSAPVCPDADDNALAGPLPKGEAFPTGHGCPPAHPGCRCIIVPVSIATGRPSDSGSAPVVADR